MNRTISIFTLGLVVLTFAAADPARAELPADRLVSYSIRLDPGNPSSAVVFDIELEISAVRVDGDEVKWFVKAAEFTERDTQGAYVRSWRVENPTLNTPDGHWWVYHDDYLNPQIVEFAEPPSLDGVADAQDPGGSDLSYSLAAGNLSPAYQNMYSGSVAAISHAFVDLGTALAIVEGQDEPAEVEGFPTEPPMG